MYATNIGILAIYGAFDDDATADAGGVPISLVMKIVSEVIDGSMTFTHTDPWLQR